MTRLPVLPQMPCNSCPHGSVCCQHGSSLTETEAWDIIGEYGSGYVTWSWEENGYRTTVVAGSCVFMVDNQCKIHDKKYYPAICAGYPFHQGRTEKPYEHPVDDCPEFKLKGNRPEVAYFMQSSGYLIPHALWPLSDLRSDELPK